MRRGETIIVSLAGDFGKPRPAVVVQMDKLAGLDTVIVCPLTSELSEELRLRPVIEPDETNGLRLTSQAMVDKITAVRLTRVRSSIGQLSPADMTRIDQVVGFVLGFRDS